MKGIVRFLKATLIGGVFVVLPVVVLYVLALKAFQLALQISTPIAAIVPQDLSPVKSPLLIAVLLIVAASFLVGLAMYSALVRRFGRWVEGQTLGRVSLYKFVKGVAGGMSEGSEGAGFRPALLTLPTGAKVFVLIVEELGDGAAAVFLPTAPTPTVGTVQIAGRDQLQALDVKSREMLQILSHWGIGARDLLEKARAEPKPPPDERHQQTG